MSQGQWAVTSMGLSNNRSPKEGMAPSPPFANFLICSSTQETTKEKSPWSWLLAHAPLTQEQNPI